MLTHEQAELLSIIAEEIGTNFDQSTTNLTALSHALCIPVAKVYEQLVALKKLGHLEIERGSGRGRCVKRWRVTGAALAPASATP